MQSIPSSRRNPYLPSVALFGNREPGIYWQDSDGMMYLLEETAKLTVKLRDDYLKHITANLIERDVITNTEQGKSIIGGYIYDPINYRAWVLNDTGNFIKVFSIRKKNEGILEDTVYGILKDYYKSVVTVVTSKSPCLIDPTLLKNSYWDGMWLQDATADKLTKALGEVGDVVRIDKTYSTAGDSFTGIYDYLGSEPLYMYVNDIYAEIESPANIITILSDRIALIKLR